MFKRALVLSSLMILTTACDVYLQDGFHLYGTVLNKRGQPVVDKVLQRVDLEIRIKSERDPRNEEKDLLLNRKFGEVSTGGTAKTDIGGNFQLSAYLSLETTQEKLVCHDVCVRESYKKDQEGRLVLDSNGDPVRECVVWAEDCGWQEYIVNNTIKDIRTITPFVVIKQNTTELRTQGTEIEVSTKYNTVVQKDTYQDIVNITANFKTELDSVGSSSQPLTTANPFANKVVRYSFSDVKSGKIPADVSAKLEKARARIAEVTGKNRK